MSKKLKIGIIGTGGIAQAAHLPAYANIPDLCEVVTLCDINPETAKLAAAKFGIARHTTDLLDIVNDPEIDAVSIATPNKHHIDPTLACLKAGKHVLCEKPLAMNAEESRVMCAAARDANRLLMVGFQTRFGGPGQFMKQYIDSGSMGDIYFARAQALRRRGVPSWGVFIDKEQQGGGPLIDIGVHILDFTLHLMGYPKPVSVFGQTWDMLGKNPDLYNQFGDYDRSKYTVEDFAAGMIKLENGAAISLESSFMANMEGDPFQTQLFGTKAGAMVQAWGDEPVKIYTEQNKQLFTMMPQNIPTVESSYHLEVEAFVRAIIEEKPSPVPGECGLILNAIFDAMYKSSETGREEMVDVSY